MRKIFKLLSGFFSKKTSDGLVMRNMAILASGSAAAQIVALIVVPVLTRIYEPEDFGVFALFSAVLIILTPFVNFRYSSAVLLPRLNGAAANLFMLCLFFTLVIPLLFGLIFFALEGYVIGRLSIENGEGISIFIVLGLFAIGLYEALSSWATREKKFKIIAKTRGIQSIGGAAIKVVLGLLGVKFYGLLIGHIVSQCMGVSSIAIQSKAGLISGLRHVSKKRMLVLARRYSDFPKYQIPSKFILAVSAQSPLLYIAAVYGADMAGQMGLALTLIGIPMTLIGSNIGQAFYAQIASLGRQNVTKIRSLTKKVLRKLILIAVFPCLLLYVLGEDLFSLVFGSEWVVAGKFVSSMTVYIMAQFAFSPLGSIFSVFEQQKKLMYMHFSRLLVVGLICLWANLYAVNVQMFVLIYSCSLAVHYVFMSTMAFKSIR